MDWRKVLTLSKRLTEHRWIVLGGVVVDVVFVCL